MRLSLSAIFQIGAALSVGTCAMSVVARPNAAADSLAAGQTLYQNKCGGCHSVDADRIGPRHRNVIGRAVASVPTYDYSPALKKLAGVWTPARVDQWLSGTQKMAPGSKMYLEMDDPAQRRLIVGYLQSVSRPAASSKSSKPRPPSAKTVGGTRRWAAVDEVQVVILMPNGFRGNDGSSQLARQAVEIRRSTHWPSIRKIRLLSPG